MNEQMIFFMNKGNEISAVLFFTASPRAKNKSKTRETDLKKTAPER